MSARKEYATLLDNLEEGKDLLVNEQDPEMKEMAREEVAACSAYRAFSAAVSAEEEFAVLFLYSAVIYTQWV